MKVLFDTSVLVAAHVPSHADYSSSRLWLERAKQGAFEFVVAAHTLMETYSVLTRLPLKPRIIPGTAWQFLETNVLPTARVVALTADDHLDLLSSLAVAGTGGGMVYDALLVKAAELAEVDVLLTFNLKHFQRLWPAHADKVNSPNLLTPPEPASPNE